MFSFDLSYYYLILLFLNCFVYAKLQFDSKPEFVSTSDDCVLKEFAWKFAQTRIDWLGELPVVFDALNLATQCGLKRPQTIANRNVLPMTPSPTSPIEFFVAPNGNDNNDGSLHNPFQTIEKGLATIRGERFNAKRQLLSAKLILRGGNYNLTSTIVITGADSNTEITRFQNEFVALRGSQPLSLQWQQQSASPNVYRAKLRSAPFQALFVDGERAVRARAPNANPATDGTRHWFKHALHWKSPRQSPPPTQINISTPAREPTLFPRFATALGGSVQQFTPQESYWGLTNPHGGGASVYRVPSGLIANQTSLFGMRSGSNQTAVVHAMHCGYWGSWAFNVDSVTKSSATVELDWTWGGFQEARGCSQGAIWFIENDLSFLDHPNEWFFDAENDYLYFFANGTHPNQLSFAKTNLEELIRIEGGAVNPVENFTLSGITLTETEPTFMKSFTVPSSGDVSLYPGAALTASKSAQLVVRSCRFVQLGGNALLLSNYNRFANISRNEFAWLGSNAICLVGRSELIDGTHGTQPRHTTIDQNLIRENGIVVKQSSAIFQAVTAQTTITNNILFNGPRAGINFNDEFGGDNLVQGNLGFNQVRETGDHGVFNSWNRTPFLTRVGDSTHTSVFTAVNRITRNFFISNYASNWPIDHDDGSARFHDTSNFLVYGGSKYFLGFEKKLSENIYVFADARQMWSRCVLAVGVQAGLSGWGETFVNNTCIYRHSTQLYQFDQSCDVRALKDRVPLLRSNTFFTPAARSLIRCGRDNFTLAQWQQTPTRPDQHSTIHDSSALSLHSIVEMGKRLLQV